jgi:hypothetical protein
MLQVKNLASQDLSKFGRDLQAILINLPIGASTKSTLSNMKKLNLDKKVIRNGIIFVWSDCSTLSQILDIMEEKGFIYIENFSIVELSREKLIQTLPERQLEELRNLKTYFFDDINPAVKLPRSNFITNEDDNYNSENAETNDGKEEDEEPSNSNKHKMHKEDVLVSEDVLLDYLLKKHNVNAQEFFLRRRRPDGLFLNTKKNLLMFRRV